MLPTLIALRRTARASRLVAWLALIGFAIGAILARDLVLLQSVPDECVAEARFARPPADKRAAKPRPSGLSKRAAWSPTDLPDDDDETDEDADTVAPSHAQVVLPTAAFVLTDALVDDRPATFAKRSFFVPIVRRHATPVRGPPRA